MNGIMLSRPVKNSPKHLQEKENYSLKIYVI